MAIELPHEIALFLNFCNIPWPDINEDDIDRAGEAVRRFSRSVSATHGEATQAIKDMGQHYSAASYRALVESWAQMSGTHMAELDAACDFVASALHGAAKMITAAKLAVIAQLAWMTRTFMSSLFTPRAAVGPIIASAAREICRRLEQSVLGYLTFDLVSKAIQPLEQVIARMVGDIMYSGLSALLDVPTSAAAAPRSGHPAYASTPYSVAPPVDTRPTDQLYLDPAEVLRYSQLLEQLAQDVLNHADTFGNDVAPLTFETPAGPGYTTSPGPTGPGYWGPVRLPSDLPWHVPDSEYLRGSPDTPSGVSGFPWAAVPHEPSSAIGAGGNEGLLAPYTGMDPSGPPSTDSGPAHINSGTESDRPASRSIPPDSIDAPHLRHSSDFGPAHDSGPPQHSISSPWHSPNTHAANSIDPARQPDQVDPGRAPAVPAIPDHPERTLSPWSSAAGMSVAGSEAAGASSPPAGWSESRSAAAIAPLDGIGQSLDSVPEPDLPRPVSGGSGATPATPWRSAGHRRRKRRRLSAKRAAAEPVSGTDDGVAPGSGTPWSKSAEGIDRSAVFAPAERVRNSPERPKVIAPAVTGPEVAGPESISQPHMPPK
ncbi:hypothetical protein D5S18_00805 [Nocardia panacis]|uniref:Outer membrane channel protein CpnT-like N-terminal domain-containing protein n=1 Tax=Nocardia panacis TaxID=2340916 RepID=A0A3A4KTI2_9NOCA|nr:hypothetical protein [Nocardia panacis]RJO79847.1 hypothetical protein D5S18_00805 [Nocardia panacis]